VRSLVSLGAPHLAPPADVRDMTGGALTWVNERWPGAHAPDGVNAMFCCPADPSVHYAPVPAN